jgi:predicted dithiol-disulfide oxidoreductase (DUF899 family)
MTPHAVGTREEWLAFRKELLKAEKEHFRRGDKIARRRDRGAGLQARHHEAELGHP